MAQISDFDAAAFRESVAEADASEAVRHAIYDLLSFAERNADRIQGGSAEKGSFLYQINLWNKKPTLFTCNGSGDCSVSLGNFAPGGAVVPGRLVSRLRSTLARIPGFDSFSKDYEVRPGFSIAQTVVYPHIMAKSQSAILRFQKDAQAL